MHTVLIANRGEIAVRIIRACRELGLATVAVCAEPDRDALYVRLADTHVALPGTAVQETYLDVGRMLDAAGAPARTRCTPGTGFSRSPRRSRTPCVAPVSGGWARRQR